MAKKAESGGYARLKGDLAQKTPGSFYVLYGEEDYLDHRALRHHRQGLEALREDLHRKILRCQAVEVEVLRRPVDELPAQQWKDSSGEDSPPRRRAHRSCRVSSAPGREKKNISPALCGYLLQRCGSSMTRLDAEIAKICAYSGADDIVRADIDAVVEPTLEAVVFEITDALGQREFDRALERLSVMLKLRAEPIAMLGAVGSHMRRLHAARILQAAGKTAQDLGAARRRAVCGQQVLCAGAAAVGPLLCAGRAAVLRGRPAGGAAPAPAAVRP